MHLEKNHPELGEISAQHKRYFDRVRGLFERYQGLTGGKLNVSFIDPEPFSDAEDRAVAAGLSGVRLGAQGEKGYFGLVATNSTDDQEVVPFFAPVLMTLRLTLTSVPE